MKKLVSVLILMVVFTAHTYASEVTTNKSTSSTPAQALKSQFINGCVSRGLERHSGAVEVAKFCTCTFEVLENELTVKEYIEVDKASTEKRSLDTVPALVRVKPKLSVCMKSK